MFVAVVLAVAARMLAAHRGFNYDFESYSIAAAGIDAGENVYAYTTRYNYGPVWFWILHVLETLSGHFDNAAGAFRYSVPTFLTLVDLAIFALLWRRFGLLVGMLALLNPIAVLVTGFHNQFDALAILIALVAMLSWERAEREGRGGRFGMDRWRLSALLLLGASLTTKHILFAFPLWLAVRQRTWVGRFFALVIPVAVFLVSFVPYLDDDGGGIRNNVFGYRSALNAPFWHQVLPRFIGELLSPMTVLFIALAAGAWAFRKRPAAEALLIYTLMIVVFAPSIANQYLAIPVAAIARFWNWIFGVYTAMVTLFLVGDLDGLRYVGVEQALPDRMSRTLQGPRAYDMPMVVLAAGFAWMLWGEEATRWMRRMARRAARRDRDSGQDAAAAAA